MRYLLIAIIMGTLTLVSVPIQADSGIAVTATTIIIGNGNNGGSYSGGNFDSNGSFPNSSPDWVSQFPSMNQQPQSSATGYTPVVQQPIPIPPVIAPQSTPYNPVTPATPATSSSPVSRMDWIVLLIIIGAACLVGLIVWIISSITGSYREEDNS